jgi:hypothetical protein
MAVFVYVTVQLKHFPMITVSELVYVRTNATKQVIQAYEPSRPVSHEMSFMDNCIEKGDAHHRYFIVYYHPCQIGGIYG